MDILLSKHQHLLHDIARSGDFTCLRNEPLGVQAGIGALYLFPQMKQGGFIQFFHNGYAFLLLPLIEYLNYKQHNDAAQILDEALKYYVIHREEIEAPEDAKSFALLYGQHPCLDIWEEQLQLLEHDILNTLVNA